MITRILYLLNPTKTSLISSFACLRQHESRFLPWNFLPYVSCCHIVLFASTFWNSSCQSLQHVFSEHFKCDPQSLHRSCSLKLDVARKPDRDVNKCCLLPGELLTLPTGSLCRLSVTTVAYMYLSLLVLLLPTVHLHSHISHIFLVQYVMNPLSLFLCFTQMFKCWCFQVPWMEGTLSHTPKCISLPLSPPGEAALQCGQSVWVGFDLSAAVAQLPCVFDSRSLKLWILHKIWCHYCLSNLCEIRLLCVCHSLFWFWFVLSDGFKGNSYCSV